MENYKKLRRTTGSEKVLFGVCGGVAKFFDIDMTFVRILWVVGFFFAGVGLLFYIILAFIMPKENTFIS
jgi:phage shock protein PspC (stress-responsive transcriptional regulator)